MRSTNRAAAVITAFEALRAEDVTALPDAVLRDELAELMTAVNQLHAQVLRRVTAFERPQVGILLTPQTLLRHGSDDHIGYPPPRGTHRDTAEDPLSAAGIPPPPEAAWLQWFGPIPDTAAQRVACDADLWRIVLDPATGLPLDVGRTHRLVPPWIRKALWARDRGCRFPGCRTPAPWTDAHHVRVSWAAGGGTDIGNLALLCRHHHVLVHEGGWSIRLDRATGAATATRPGGIPYEIPPSRPWTGPTTQAA